MKKHFKLIIIFILISACGYSPIYSFKKNDFVINNIQLSGDKKLNKIILRELNNYQSKKNTNTKLDLSIITRAVRVVSTKNTKGDPETYNLSVNLELKVVKNLNKTFNKNFNRSINYNSIASKFDLKKYEDNAKKNLIGKVTEDIMFYLGSL